MLKLSASSMGTYEKCPKKYHYQYIEKPDIVKPDWTHLEFGKCAHRALELFHIDIMNNVRTPSDYSNIMRDSFKQAVSEFRMEILKPELPFLKSIIQDYLNLVKTDGLPPVVGVEHSFEFDIGGYIVRGFIDRIDKIGPGEYRVVDYKTNKNPKYLTSFQLLLYGLAMQRIFPDMEKLHGRYILLKHKSITKDWSFTSKDLEDTKNKILAIGESISTDQAWEKKPTMLCDWCDFKSICQDSWSDE
jgi:putative RecB family exonuclease